MACSLVAGVLGYLEATAGGVAAGEVEAMAMVEALVAMVGWAVVWEAAGAVVWEVAWAARAATGAVGLGEAAEGLVEQAVAAVAVEAAHLPGLCMRGGGPRPKTVQRSAAHQSVIQHGVV